MSHPALAYTNFTLKKKRFLGAVVAEGVEQVVRTSFTGLTQLMGAP